MRRLIIQLLEMNQLAEFLQRIVVFTFEITLPSIRSRELLVVALAYLPAEVRIKLLDPHLHKRDGTERDLANRGISLRSNT